MERLGGPGGLRPEIRAQRSARDSGRGFDLNGAGRGDGVRVASVPQIAVAQNRRMRDTKLFRQLTNPASLGNGSRNRVFCSVAHGHKFVSTAYRCQARPRKDLLDLVSEVSPGCGQHAGMDQSTFSHRFRWACAQAGYDLDVRGNQTRLAAVLGVRSQAISQWMSLDTFPATAHMLKMAEIFGVSLDWLFTGRGNPIPGDNLTEEEWALIRRWRTYSPVQKAKISGVVEEIPPRLDDCEQAA